MMHRTISLKGRKTFWSSGM